MGTMDHVTRCTGQVEGYDSYFLSSQNWLNEIIVIIYFYMLRDRILPKIHRDSGHDCNACYLYLIQQKIFWHQLI